MAYDAHLQQSSEIAARCAVITLSDTRTAATDKSGQAILQALKDAGHNVASYEVLPDDAAKLLAALEAAIARDDLDAIITNGGTGISERDRTIPTIEQILDQALPGFGELFRMLSWEQIGSGAMLSRALAGMANRKMIFALPGSTKAVELAMSRLILPELRHLIHELRK